MSEFSYPKSQSELLRVARGDLTQAEFARELRVDRTCLCRYERERLGAPSRVINHCLERVAAMAAAKLPDAHIDRALLYTKNAMKSLEEIKKAKVD